MGQEGLALRRGSLRRPTGQAVPPVIERRHLEAHRRLSGEEVIREGEVLKAGQSADGGRNLAGEEVVGDIQLLEAEHPSDGVWQGPDELVEAEIEDGEVLEEADLGREARSEAVVEENDLVEGPGHVANACRDASPEAVVGEDDD